MADMDVSKLIERLNARISPTPQKPPPDSDLLAEVVAALTAERERADKAEAALAEVRVKKARRQR